tara:strand:- start:1219 stop:1386 length:168 start_codon:yes stop_codon:yes gene_type:complete
MDEINNKIIKAQDERIALQDERVELLTRMLTEIESQLEDRGGFDILRLSINNVIK